MDGIGGINNGCGRTFDLYTMPASKNTSRGWPVFSSNCTRMFPGCYQRNGRGIGESHDTRGRRGRRGKRRWGRYHVAVDKVVEKHHLDGGPAGQVAQPHAQLFRSIPLRSEEEGEWAGGSGWCVTTTGTRGYQWGAVEGSAQLED